MLIHNPCEIKDFCDEARQKWGEAITIIDRMMVANEQLGPWLAPMMDDPLVCDECKKAIGDWYASFEDEK